MSDSTASERLVLSEVHVGSSALDEETEVVSRYTYLTPTSSSHGTNVNDSSSDSSDSEADEGESGDDSSGNVARRRKRPRHTESQRSSRPAHEVLTVVHRMATTLGLVGQQVWSAAFLLGDFVLTHEDLFAGKQVLELGAGPGVAGVIAARVALKCYLTDYHHEVLKLLARNVEANRHLFAFDCATTAKNGEDNPQAEGSAGVCGGDNPEHGDVTSESSAAVVRELDWFTFSKEDGPTDAAICDTFEDGKQGEGRQVTEGEAAMASGDKSTRCDSVHHPFTWSKGELEGLSASTRTGGGGLIIIAADVIYDEGLTEALFDVLTSLMPPLVPRDGDRVADSKNCRGISDRTPATQTSPCPTANSADVEVDVAFSDTHCGRKHVEQARADVSRVTDDGEAVLFLALEKRFNFSLAELSVAATGYNALLRNVLDVTGGRGEEGKRAEACPPQAHDKMFEGRRLPLSFQQCFRYQRSNAMELWEIRRRPTTCYA